MGCTQTRNAVAVPVNMKAAVENRSNLKSKYTIVPKILGSGKMGTVYAATLRTNPDTKVAIKVVNKIKNKENMKQVYREVEILKSLSHPNIVKYIECYENEYNLYIVMESCTKGELSVAIKRKIRNNLCFSEHDARENIRKILEAVSYCHSKNVVHGNLNPSNIMLDNEHGLKLIDFDGLIKYTNLGIYQSFVAPEVTKGSPSTAKSDIWSIGMIMYVLLVGRYPFTDDSYQFSEKLWDGISEEAQSLISSMLEVDPSKRITIKKCLEHAWFDKELEVNNFIDDFLLESEMGESVATGKALTISVANGDEYKRNFSEEIIPIKGKLEELDTNKSTRQYGGSISSCQAKRVVQKTEWMQKIDEEIHGINASKEICNNNVLDDELESILN